MNVGVLITIIICCAVLPVVISISEKNKKNKKVVANVWISPFKTC
ncbi:hypothetical protein SCA04_02060 [Staphylococcus carnosus]|nr:hypothetical protein SCA04_02060 [Staphylococcus carnosus]